VKTQFLIPLFLFYFTSVFSQPLGSWTDGKTLRLDFIHSGTDKTEEISLDGFRLEGPWPGPSGFQVDSSGLGLFRGEVVLKTGKTVYAEGFSSIFGEWQTTSEAKTGYRRAFHESFRFPNPNVPAEIRILRRDPDGRFSLIGSFPFNPESRQINRAPVVGSGKLKEWFIGGEPAKKVDLAVLAEGYSEAEMEKFFRDSDRLCTSLFSTEPFRSRKQDFNIRHLFVASPESGIPNPRKDQWPFTAFGFQFNFFDSDRYVLSSANKQIREVLAQVPYDAVIIVCNSPKYGGGGIYHLYASVTADTEPAEYVFIHEFGHSFAGLGDEYYTSDVAYDSFNPPGFEPNEPNITALLPNGSLKWQELADPGIPIPTPWKKRGYDSLSADIQKRRSELIRKGASEKEMESLFREDRDKTQNWLRSEQYYGKTGAFEGAGYESRGLFRPELDCIMFSRNPDHFCKVCNKAISEAINRLTQ